MRRTIVLLTAMTMLLLMATSVAMAQNAVNCPSSGLCKGTNASDLVFGGSGDNTLLGYDGDDAIFGGPGWPDITTGKDTMLGGLGTDQMWGGAGDDAMYGEDGNDRTRYGGGLWGGPGDDYISGGNGDDSIFGGLMDETGHDYDRLSGGPGEDDLYGGRYNDFYYGGADNDLMRDDSKVSNDTYVGLDPISEGYYNQVLDFGGDGDILDLSTYLDRSQVSITWVDSADPDANRDSLRVTKKGTNDSVLLRDYFDNKGGTGRGVGAIENIRFKGGITVGFPAPQG